MPLAQAICGRIAAELAGNVPMDDLLSAAAFGLVEAVERYNPRMGTRFETYCALRVRGAVLDELRCLRAAPRLRTNRAKLIESGDDRDGASRRPVRDGRVRGHAVARVSLSAQPPDSEDIRRLDIIEARDVCDPAVLLQEKERRDMLAREVRRLPSTERLLVMLYYYDELTMKQIGQLLSVTESRVCQMHTEILERLQQRLAGIDGSTPHRRAFSPVLWGGPKAVEVADA